MVAVTVLGATVLAHSAARWPMVASVPGFEPVVRVGAAVAALGSLLSLILGVSRTTLAMARDGHLPGALAAVHPRFGFRTAPSSPWAWWWRYLAAFADVRGVIGSSFGPGVLRGGQRPAITLGRQLIPVAGLAGCAMLAAALPIASIVAGVSVLALGAGAYALHRHQRGGAA